MLSNEFPIKRGVLQGCPLSPILFNLFINDILNDCEKYSVNIGRKKGCGGLFADDVVLIAPSAKNLEKLLEKVHKWANLNEMTFGIEKCATMVIKPMNFQSPPNYSDQTFYLGMNAIPKVSSYIYLGIPFSDDLLLEHIISHMHFKVRKSLLSFTRFFSNKLIPIAYKKKVLQSFIISKVIYYSLLLGSNKSRTARIQTLINTGLFWCIGSFSINGKTSSENNDYIRHNSTMSTYALSRDLSIPPIAGICATLQIKSFTKWSKSNCIIKDLIKSIPKMPYYFWTKESITLYKKIKKYKCEKYDDILERYWKSVSKFQGIKGQNYDCNKFSNNKAIIMHILKYPQFNLGFSWIIRLRCGYKYNTTIAIRMG